MGSILGFIVEVFPGLCSISARRSRASVRVVRSCCMGYGSQFGFSWMLKLSGVGGVDGGCGVWYWRGWGAYRLRVLG